MKDAYRGQSTVPAGPQQQKSAQETFRRVLTPWAFSKGPPGAHSAVVRSYGFSLLRPSGGDLSPGDDVLRGNLYGLAVEGKALSAGFSLSTLPKSGLGFVAAAFPGGSEPQTLLKAVRNVLADNVANGFPADLVATAKRHAATDAEFEKNSISCLAMAWPQALAIEGRQSS